MAERNPGTSRQQQIMESTGDRYENSTSIRIQNLGSSNTFNIGTNAQSKINNLNFELPGLPDYDIVGRDSDVRNIMGLFNNGNKRVAICAMGGMGKTTLSIYCAHIWQGKCTNTSQSVKRFKGDGSSNFFKSIAYFTVENRSNFEESVKRLATKLNINKEQSITEVVKDIVKLYENDQFLIIIDNLIKFTDVRDLVSVQKESKNLFILATSQNHELNRHFHIYKLNLISEEHGLDLFLSVTKHNIHNDIEETQNKFRSTYKQLHELVDGLPISLSHAAAWIAHRMDEKTLINYRATTEVYISLIEEYLTTFTVRLSEDFPEQFANSIDKSAFLALAINMDKLTHNESKELLIMISYLDPEYIKIDIFNILFNKDELESALVDLSKFSLIYIVDKWNGKTIRIHRLVQKVTRTHLESKCRTHMGALIIKLACDWNGNRHLNFMINNLNSESNLPHWLSFCSKEKLQSVINKTFELIEDNWILCVLKDAGCHINDAVNWPVPHKYMLKMRCDFEIVVTSILDKIFKDFKDEYRSGVEDGITLHHIAAANYRIKVDNIFEFLVKNGIDINKTTTKQHLSPLHVANSKKTVAQIVSLGLDVNVRDIDENTPLHTICINGYYDAVEVLLSEPNIQLDARNKQEKTPLQTAIDDEWTDWWVFAKQMFKVGARYDFRWENGDRILHRVAKYTSLWADERYNLMKCIVDRIESDGQICVDDINQDGDTAAHLVVCWEYDDDNDDFIIKTLVRLVKADANLQIKNNQGHTPLSLAEEKQLRDEVINFLKNPSDFVNYISESN